VLHPDELHDGAPGTDDGFTYQIVYLAPELIREALAPLLDDLAEPIGRLRAVEAAVAVADGLAHLAGRGRHRSPSRTRETSTGSSSRRTG